MFLPWPSEMQEGNAPYRAQPDTGGAAPLVIPIFSIFGICAKLLGSQWWGAGGARLLHLFKLGPEEEATPRHPNNVPGSLAWVPAAPD